MNRSATTSIRRMSDPATTRGRVHAALLLFLLPIIAYAPIYRGGFIWDDDSYVTNNPSLRNADGLLRIWLDPAASPQYYPLTFTMFRLEYQLWRDHPSGYHVVNVLLHAAAALLLFGLLRRLEVPGAWLAAAVFAVHPVHVESVAWITERKNVLSGVLYLAAAAAYLRFAGLIPSSIRRGPLYGAALFLFACALLSKTVTCSLPVALLLVLWWKRSRIGARDIVPLAPFFVLGAVLGIMTIRVEQAHVGTEQIDLGLSFAQRCVIAGMVPWFYLGKLIWPADLSFVYPRWTPDLFTAPHALAPVTLLAAVVASWLLRHRIGRGPATAASFFVVTLFPALGFVDVFPFLFSFVADHFQYLASIGPIAAAAWLLHRVAPARLRSAASAACIITLAALTMGRSVIFSDAETLWRDTLAKNDAAWMAHQNLGVLLDYRGETDEAIDHFQRAMELHPGDYKLHVNLAVALGKKGRTAEALAHFDSALALNPKSWTAHYNLAATLAALDRDEEAIRHFETTLQNKPDMAAAAYNIGVLLQKQGRLDEAAVQFRRALDIDPEFTAARTRLERYER